VSEDGRTKGFRSSRYVVVKYGYVNRGETMNIAVMAWEHAKGPTMPVYQRVIPNWDRINQAFPRAGAEDFQEDAVRRLEAIKTVGDYEHVLLRIGPYTPFEFTDERPSTATPQDTLEQMSRLFLGPYQG
jgi:hypothetical protein